MSVNQHKAQNEGQGESVDDRLTARSREVFDDAVANLDGATRSRLTRARHAALQAVQTTRSPMRWLVPTGSVAALALVTVMSVHFWQVTRSPVQTAAEQAGVVEDLEIVTADADLDMLKDMDFYAWLDTQDIKTAEAGEEG